MSDPLPEPPHYRRLTGVLDPLWLAYRLTARQVLTMLVPAVVVLVPFGVLLVATETVLLGQRTIIVNGAVVTSKPPGAAYLAWLAALAVAGAVAFLVALAAGMILTAGRLLDRPVPPLAALRVGLRRLPALLVLALLALVVTAVILTAGRFLTDRGIGIPIVFALMVIGALVALPYLLAFPVAVLERRGPLRALGRANALMEHRKFWVSLALLVGAILVPGLTTQAAGWAVRPLGGLAHTLADQSLQRALQVIAVPFLAATLTTLFLAALRDQAHTRARRLRPQVAEWDAELVQRLQEEPRRPAVSPQPRRWAAAVVAALVLPGLLYVGYGWTNPLARPAVIDHELRLEQDADLRPPRLHYDAAGRPVAVIDDTMFTCSDPVCDRSSAADVELPVAYRSASIGTAMLPDDRLAVAAWRGDPDDEDAEDGLRLAGCDPSGCTGSAPVLSIAAGSRDNWGFGAAVAVAPDGAITIAHLRRVDGDERAGLRLTRCADLGCAQPHTVELLADVRVWWLSRAARPLGVAIGPDGSAVVGYLNTSGAVTVAVCDSPRCASPTVTELVRPSDTGIFTDDSNPWPGLDVVVRPGGVPVIGYRHAATGAARLLVCRNPACTAAEDVTLTGPGLRRPGPAVGLDRAGRLMVATYEPADRLVLITCADERCADRSVVPVATLEHGPGHVALGFTPDGRPQVLRTDTSASEYFRGTVSLRLTTCAAPDCR